MKRYIKSSTNQAWMAKYTDPDKRTHKVVAELPTGDFEEAESMFDEIIFPYVSLHVLGRAPSVAMAERDGFEVLQY